MGEINTITQVSAGGAAFRMVGGAAEVALISVGEERRWQLPKGRVYEHETSEEAAQREVSEEAGIKTELLAPIDEIDYWFYVTKRGRQQRVHKFVKFYLMRYVSGAPDEHDQEVMEARWVEIDQAHAMLAFENEKNVILKAKNLIDRI